MKQYDKLATERSWTVLLKALPEGATKVRFPDADAVKSCKSIAYQPYGEMRNFSFSFKATDDPCVMEISKNRT